MDKTAELVLSLEDLLQIALGTESITGVNTIVLHSLLDLVLQKLGCENEKISISGHDAMVIEKLLQESSISPLAFESNQMKTITQFDCLGQLEITVKDLEEQIDKHLEEVQHDKLVKGSNNSISISTIFSREHICSTCDPDMKDMCNFIADTKFKHIILEHTILPVYKHLQAMSQKLEDFEIEFLKWLEFMEQHLKTISQKDTVMMRILQMDEELTMFRNEFMDAMDDLQDILDTKVDRCDVVALQNVFEQRVEVIKKTMREYIATALKANTTVFALESHTADGKVFETSPSKTAIDPICDCQVYVQPNMGLQKASEQQTDLDSKKPKLNFTIKRSYSSLSP
ncbi:uncharacterized protein LOC126763731 [Bactrocera neohumeralis]|uniref:uncharacterized protein LOC126763731 n=1 Tax=Bactrocera neohumeralis TaxID=98809 RepID=UPI0021656981|nr:uncharacterized protein LOC126763731 [Bactrocera neohumeralis]